MKLFNVFSLSLLNLFFCYIITATNLIAQDTLKSKYPAVNESILLGSKWRYTYMTHAESNTVLHRAENGYEYFLHLKYDYTLEHYLNGTYFKSTWKLSPNGNELFYKFRQLSWWKIAEYDTKHLVLEFQNNAKSSYRYHFVAISDSEGPFVREAYELPSVEVDAYSENTSKLGIGKARFGKSKKKQKDEQAKKDDKPKKVLLSEPIPTYIRIELIGGGFYGGLDPVYRDYTKIETDGKIIREFMSEKKGLIKTKRQINRKELEDLIKFFEMNKLFEMNKAFECEDELCEKRSKRDPLPMPLRLVVTHGSRRKVVTVDIYGGDDRKAKYINYPKELENIVHSIQVLAQ